MWRASLMSLTLSAAATLLLGLYSSHHGSTMLLVLRRNLQENDNDNESDHDEDFTTQDLTSITCIVLVLILLTILFEEGKHRIEHGVSHDNKIIVERLFGELTVLGFLAMTIFILAQSGALRRISHALHEQEEALEETLEDIHYALFCIMIFFVIQVWVLMGAASQTEQEWSEMEEKCLVEDKKQAAAADMNKTSPSGVRVRRGSLKISLSRDDQEALQHLQQSRWYTWFAPQLNNEHDERVRNQLVYAALRDEFLLERSSGYPYAPVTDENRLPTNFNFGRYLALCQVGILSHLVMVEHTAWICCAAATVLYYFFALAVQEHWIILAWAWVAIGWFVYLYNVIFEYHLQELRNLYLPRRLVTMLKQGPASDQILSYDSNKTAALLSDEPDPDDLPAWCEVEKDEGQLVHHQSWVRYTSPHTLVFCWLERGGPHLYLLILQLNLIFVGVYVACLLLAYIPSVLTQYPTGISVVYMILAVLPVIGITYNKRRLVATLTQCLCVGPAHRKLHVVGDVLREAKTDQAVRALLFICVMRRVVEQLNTTTEDDKSATSSSYSNDDLQQAALVFKHFAADGYMTYADLDTFFTHLGLTMTNESREQLKQSLDSDGDGRVTRDEFLDWYAEQVVDKVTEYDQARDMFQLFDLDGDGKITLSEFKNRLDALNLGFTVDEIGAIIQELDWDRSGTFSFDEFEHLLKKYYPRTLKERRDAARGVQDRGCCD